MWTQGVRLPEVQERLKSRFKCVLSYERRYVYYWKQIQTMMRRYVTRTTGLTSPENDIDIWELIGMGRDGKPWTWPHANASSCIEQLLFRLLAFRARDWMTNSVHSQAVAFPLLERMLDYSETAYKEGEKKIKRNTRTREDYWKTRNTLRNENKKLRRNKERNETEKENQVGKEARKVVSRKAYRGTEREMQ